MAAELEGTHACTPAFSTPNYTPPELLSSEIGNAAAIRASADVWAFGVLAHLVLTDTFPLPGGALSARRDAAVRYARGTDELRLSPRLQDGCGGSCGTVCPYAHGAISGETLLRRVEEAAGTSRSPRLPRLRARRGRRSTLVLAAAAATVAVSGLAYGMTTWAGDSGSGTEGGEGRAPATEKIVQASYGAGNSVPARVYRPIPAADRSIPRTGVCRRRSPGAARRHAEGGERFDPGLSDPGDDEYGIAVGPAGAALVDPVRRRHRQADPRAPLLPRRSIPAMNRYLCWIAPRLDPKLGGDHRV